MGLGPQERQVLRGQSLKLTASFPWWERVSRNLGRSLQGCKLAIREATPSKTNIEPENSPLWIEKYRKIIFQTSFWRFHVRFRWCNYWCSHVFWFPISTFQAWGGALGTGASCTWGFLTKKQQRPSVSWCNWEWILRKFTKSVLEKKLYPQEIVISFRDSFASVSFFSLQV